MSKNKTRCRLAVWGHLAGHFSDARALYEVTLTDADTHFDGVLMMILYNLARVYEDMGDIEMARGAYKKLLTWHPEYVDGASR